VGEQNELRDAVAEGLRNLEEFLDKIPGGGVTRDVRDRVGALRQLLVEQRDPRFALVGRRGSGKSSLINAIMGEPIAVVGHETSATGRGAWYAYSSERGRLRILDTRGLQEGSRPDCPDDAASPRESILKELRAECPDAVLFLIKAKEVDSAVDGDLSEVEHLLKAAHEEHGAAIPLLAVVTSCDELEPKNVKLHAPEGEDARDIEEKLARVRAVERHLEVKIRDRAPLKDRLIGVLGVSSYQSWRGDGSRRADERWRIDALVGKLVDELPKEARVGLVRLSQIKHLQRSLAGTIAMLIAGICAAIAVLPIPGSDIVPITSMQVSLVASVAHVSGRTMTLRSSAEFLGAIGMNVGLSFAFRELARGLVKLVPAAGSAASAAIAYATTLGIGKAAAAYFIDGVGPGDARRILASTRDAERERYARAGE
jgi:predicted GTPase/uncharacterized protein (DUF697 family)